MATSAEVPQTVPSDLLVNYLTSMARMVEGTVNRALDALLRQKDPESCKLAGDVLLVEPRVNEMEMVIDDYAVRLLRAGKLAEDQLRLIVATLKINNDLERMGDLAVNVSERVISLDQMPGAEAPPELAPMIAAVRAMVNRSLGALVFRNVEMATGVLESDDMVDRYRDQVFERLLSGMTRELAQVPAKLQFVLATRYLERIADHATNVAEDVIYWVRGLDVRHGRGISQTTNAVPSASAASGS